MKLSQTRYSPSPIYREGGVTKANHAYAISISQHPLTLYQFSIVGTAGSIVTMLLGFGLFLRKRKKQL